MRLLGRGRRRREGAAPEVAVPEATGELLTDEPLAVEELIGSEVAVVSGYRDFLYGVTVVAAAGDRGHRLELRCRLGQEPNLGETLLVTVRRVADDD